LRRRIRSFPFLSPPVGGSLHYQRSLRAPRGSTFSKLNDYTSQAFLAHPRIYSNSIQHQRDNHFSKVIPILLQNCVLQF